ncbi:MAG TPA: adenylate/guanylate cyclase domain-containing protein [Gaiellaceae bacterium]|nr:adenylate/guanylate cyclase domain-containing protein [Gaiellaceae bacterium]
MTCAACGATNREEARFCDTCGARLDAPPKRELRKVVTVLFCDVAGSTALGEQLDPEALRAVMARYFDVAKTAIERHGGTLEKFIGDAVMAVFGVPTIREDDALRAVRAAQELRDGVDIDIRIGVNTGEVVTSVEDSLVTGDAVNVAARLEQAAASGEVLLGEETYRLVRDAVQVAELPSVEAKGKSEPLRAYRLVSVTGDTPYARRLDAPLVGRDVERGLLAGAWRRTCDERACSLFTILGAAGIGKSRLAAEFLDELDATIVTGRCLSYGDGITYWPVVEIVMRLLAGDPPNTALAALLGDGHATAPDISFAVRKLFEVKAAERPLVVVFDDVQWAEPTLLDLIEEAADWIRGAPILILCLARPELLDERPTWGGGKLNATTVLLEALTGDQTEELIEALLAGATIDRGVRARIREAADGNPLFVEQMLAMVADGGDGALTVPSTIQALLAARIDQLPVAERAALERGAIEGQVFHRGAVVALAPEDPEVPARLLRLVRKELVRPSLGVLPGDDAFRFRHLLIRDAAYDALPKSVRADLHQRFAAWLSEHGTSVIELDEILGFHLEQAARYLDELGKPSREVKRSAAEYLAKSGRRAYNRSDIPATTNLMSRAASLFDAAEEARLRLVVTLGAALYRCGRLVEAAQTLSETVEAAKAHGFRGIELDAGMTLAEVELHRAPDPEIGQSAARESVRAAIESAEAESDPERLGRALMFGGRLHFWAGEMTEAEAAFERAGVAAREAGDVFTAEESTAYLIGCWHLGSMPVDDALPRVDEVLGQPDLSRGLRRRALVGRARFTAMLGRFDEARADLAEVEELERELGARTTSHSGEVELLAGDFAAAETSLRRMYDELIAASDYGHLASVSYLLAEAVLGQGRIEEALELTAGVDAMTVPEDVDAQAGWRRVRAKALANQGAIEEAVQLAREAAAIGARTEYYEVRAASVAALGEVLRLAQSDEAESVLREALDLHEQKGNRVEAARIRQVLGPPAT